MPGMSHMKLVAGFYKTCEDACRFQDEQNRVFVLSHPEPSGAEEEFLRKFACREGLMLQGRRWEGLAPQE